MMRHWIARLWLVCLVLLAPAAVEAAAREARLPLRDGQFHRADLTALLGEQLGLPAFDCPIDGTIDLRGLRGNLFIRALNRSLGDGCRISIEPDQLVVRIDPDQLPHDLAGAKRAVRIFTAVAAPSATADQSRLYGLLLPHDLNVDKPLVVLIHGLDCNRGQWNAMASLLTAAGHQVAYFTFPSDQPLVDSVNLLDEHLAALTDTFPGLTINLLAYSMGGLVARGYVEGPTYRGEVSRLIMIAPPNHGSKWATYRLALEVEEHYKLWRTNDEWRWTWPITDGLGEAGRDIKPRSEYLQALNSLGRREGVRYTIIAGNRHPARRITANLVEAPLKWTPKRTDRWWGFRHTRSALKRWAGQIRSRPGHSDGPVKLASAQLEGVEDFVVLPADHSMLYQSDRPGEPPAAWAVIRERLANLEQ